jgi:hypothetical protein
LIDYPFIGIFDLTKSLSLETEGGFFSFSLDEKPPELGQVPGHSGVFIDYPVIGIIDLMKSLSLETEGGFFLFGVPSLSEGKTNFCTRNHSAISAKFCVGEGRCALPCNTSTVSLARVKLVARSIEQTTFQGLY